MNKMLVLEKTIAEQNASIKGLKQQITKPCIIKMDNEETFVSNPRKNAKGEPNPIGAEF